MGEEMGLWLHGDVSQNKRKRERNVPGALEHGKEKKCQSQPRYEQQEKVAAAQREAQRQVCPNVRSEASNSDGHSREENPRLASHAFNSVAIEVIFKFQKQNPSSCRGYTISGKVLLQFYSHLVFGKLGGILVEVKIAEFFAERKINRTKRDRDVSNDE